MIILTIKFTDASSQNIDEKVRKIINDRQDKYNLRYNTEFVVDCSENMLIPHIDGMTVKDFIIAKISPEIRMMIVPGLDPAYFFDYPKENGLVFWADWGHPVRSKDNRFYFALSDDRKYG